MKYTMLMASLLTATVLQAQIGPIQKSTPSVSVGKVSPGVFIAELSFQINPADSQDTIYALRYRDYQYKQIVEIKSVQFSGIGDTEDQLYKVFKSVFLDENKSNKDYLVTFTLGENAVSIGNYKSMGSTLALFMFKNSYFYLTEKQVGKLFGK